MPTPGGELIRAMAAGNRDAFAQLYDRYAALVLPFVLRIVRERADAVEVRAEDRQLVAGALAQLSEAQREVIELAYYSGLTQTEIAERLEQPLGTVKTRIRLALARLREVVTPP